MRMNELSPDLVRLKEGWMFVGSAFQRGSAHCDGCGYCESKSQLLPYQDGEAEERWTECALGRRVTDKPEDCPAYAEFRQEQKELEE